MTVIATAVCEEEICQTLNLEEYDEIRLSAFRRTTDTFKRF